MGRGAEARRRSVQIKAAWSHRLGRCGHRGFDPARARRGRRWVGDAVGESSKPDEVREPAAGGHAVRPSDEVSRVTRGTLSWSRARTRSPRAADGSRKHPPRRLRAPGLIVAAVSRRCRAARVGQWPLKDPFEFLEVGAVGDAVGEAFERDEVRQPADQHPVPSMTRGSASALTLARSSGGGPSSRTSTRPSPVSTCQPWSGMARHAVRTVPSSRVASSAASASVTSRRTAGGIGDEHVDIARRADVAVRDHRPSADHDVVDAGGVEVRQDRAVVAWHVSQAGAAWRPARRARCRCPGAPAGSGGARCAGQARDPPRRRRPNRQRGGAAPAPRALCCRSRRTCPAPRRWYAQMVALARAPGRIPPWSRAPSRPELARRCSRRSRASVVRRQSDAPLTAVADMSEGSARA